MQSAPSSPGTFFVRGARQLLTLRGPVPRRGLSCSELGVIHDGSLLIAGGRIEEVGATRRIENLRKARNARVIDVSGKVVTPGLVDSHMRIGSGSPDLRAFEQRIAGLPEYLPPEEEPPLDRASVDRSEAAKRWLRLASAGGATTVELRSGEGLDALRELRALRALAKLSVEPIETIVGFTYAPPAERRTSARASQAVLAALMEILSKAAAAPRIAAAFDLDCAGGRCDWDLARQCLQIARSFGYRVSLQSDGGRSAGGILLAVEAAAASVERLDGASEADIDLLAASSTVATLLPSVAYHAGSKRFPPARRLLDRGATVSLASGFSPDRNPGFGLQAAMTIACREMRLMPEEAIACCTINAAVAVGREATIGSLEPDKHADLAVFDVGDYREIPYYFGVDMCWLTMKQGRVIHRAGSLSTTSGSRFRGDWE